MKLLYVDITQFGYHTDAYFYARHLSEHMEVTYIGCDHGKRKFEPGNVSVIYVPFRGNKLSKHYHFYSACVRELKQQHYDCVFICYTFLSSILRLLFPFTKMIIDVRTGYVEPNRIINWLFNTILRLELLFFRHKTFISEELAGYMHYGKKHGIMPVGAEYIPDVPAKKFDHISILYIGTFFGRRIEDTIRGFARFIGSYDHSLKVKYYIIGFGPGNEAELIRSEIDRLGMNDYIEFKGEIRYPETAGYFLKCNAGVSYVPVTPYYNRQPVTKNFEYFMYGMPVIATATRCNQKIISKQTGILIPDNEEGFYLGMKELAAKIGSFNSSVIRETAVNYSYERIVRGIVEPYIRSVTGKE